MTEGLNIALLVSTTCIELSNLNKFSIGIEIKNTGSEPVVFDLSKTQLNIDGRPSFSWNLSVQNGTGTQPRIPAGQTFTISWPLGEALFEDEGTFSLELMYGDVRLDQKLITITQENENTK